MTETTAPVQSLVDEILAELESAAVDLDEGDGLRRAAELIRQQRKELKAIEAMARMLADGEWAEHVGELGGPIAQRLETEITRMHNEQQAAPAAVPDGWKPVPVEPTQEMWAAYRNADSGGVLFHQAYRAMLASAPTPPAQQSQLYTCIGKGGRYEKVGSAKPAGIANFEHNIGAVIVYRDIESDHLYFRLPLDFNRRMKRISPGDTAAPEQDEQDAVKVPRKLLERIVIAESQGDGPALREAVDELRDLLGGGA